MKYDVYREVYVRRLVGLYCPDKSVQQSAKKERLTFVPFPPIETSQANANITCHHHFLSSPISSWIVAVGDGTVDFCLHFDAAKRAQEARHVYLQADQAEK